MAFSAKVPYDTGVEKRLHNHNRVSSNRTATPKRFFIHSAAPLASALTGDLIAEDTRNHNEVRINMRDHNDRFIERLDSLILSGRSSFEIGHALGIRDTSVRKRRRVLRGLGKLPFEGNASNVSLRTNR